MLFTYPCTVESRDELLKISKDCRSQHSTILQVRAIGCVETVWSMQDDDDVCVVQFGYN